jgi:hypothetical protein
MKKVGAAFAVAGVTAMAVAGGALAASDKILDSVTVKAKPSGDKVQIAAVEGPAERIEITLSEERGGKFKLLGKDRVNGADLEDGKVEISAERKGKDAGTGELNIGRHYSEEFSWSLKTGKIFF